MCRIGPSSSTVGSSWRINDQCLEDSGNVTIGCILRCESPRNQDATQWPLGWPYFSEIPCVTDILRGFASKVVSYFGLLSNHSLLVVSRNHQPHQMGRSWICRGGLIRHPNITIQFGAPWRILVHVDPKNNKNSTIFWRKSTKTKNISFARCHAVFPRL